MALSIINNSTAIGAQSSVNMANNNLTKTIKSLSTGLRINSAADDASGLAVSEKLRAQISGLSKAATNAQDAISMLQTAEGAMGSMTSMVQRIRELAVQAGDPVYTSNDRAMLQLEVDQLKEEIDRVSTSTEFNTKKLLNGDAAALWSSSSSDLEAIVNGSVAEGNYAVTYSVDPGKNSVYKSQIMSLANGNTPGKITDGASAIKTISFRGITITADGTTISISANGTLAAERVVGGTLTAANVSTSGSISGAYFVEVSGGNVTVVDSMSGSIIAKQALVTAGDTEVSIGAGKIIIAEAAVTGDQSGLITIASGITTTGGLLQGAADSDYGVLAYGLQKGNKYDVAIAHWIDGKGAEYGTLTVDYTGTTATTVDFEKSAYVDKNTKLSDLAQFTNADGRMVLDNTQELSIYAGNGQNVSIFIEGSDTIGDLEGKLSTALIELGLGTSSNMVKYVNTTAATTNGAVPGTFIIQGATLGEDSNLSFVGDQGLLNALGIQQIQKATDSAMSVSVKNAHTGAVIGADIVTDGRVRNIIEGVDLDLNPTGAVNVKFNSATYTMDFSASTAVKTINLHLTDNATKAAIGANEGQTLDLSIGRLDTKSLNIDAITVASFEDSQKAITKLDMALEQISKARATAGAQMNRLEYTINNLNTTRENMVASESRIRDLDIAQASTDLAAQQVVLQSATAMLAQANQIPSYAMQLLG